MADLRVSLPGFASKFRRALILDNNSEYFQGLNYNDYDLIAGFSDARPELEITNFQQLSYINIENADWYLGYIGYDNKNNIENLYSSNQDYQLWPGLFFFKPQILLLLRKNVIEIFVSDEVQGYKNIFSDILKCNASVGNVPDLRLKERISRDDYLYKAGKLMEHIKKGNIYEVNFCMEFYDEVFIDPSITYYHLNKRSPAPFSAFLKIDEHNLICASPERFLKHSDGLIISQPMKGTAPRGDPSLSDRLQKEKLFSNPKEFSENIMITDLVRNDLSKIALKNSVKVEDLCGIYTFPQVLQMVSTISAKTRNVSFGEIIKALFPMGSMTGAPKISAMELIEKYETVKRGIYSGCVGYIAPGMNFDFNVVIRSLQYNEDNRYLSYMTGSALTALSDINQEYEECLLKNYAFKLLYAQNDALRIS